MKKFLMCEPVAFDVSYVINPWMQVGAVNKQLALWQWKSLYTHMKKFSNIELVDTTDSRISSVPDIVFTANAAFLYQGVAYPSRFAYVERQGETPIYTDNLKRLGYIINNSFVDSQMDFEGAGDALLSADKKTLFLGWGHRSHQNAWQHFTHTDLEILSLRLVSPHFYHLDTCFCPLSDGYALVHLAAFDEKSQKLLKDYLGQKLIYVSFEDAKLFACNAVEYEPYEVIMNDCSEQLKYQMLCLGFMVHHTSLSEYLKSGGAAKCLTLQLE